MNERGRPMTEQLLQAIEARLTELREVAKRFELVSDELPFRLRELARLAEGEAVSDEQFQDTLRATVRRLDTALRSRKASVDLDALRRVAAPSSAVEMATRWTPQDSLGSVGYATPAPAVGVEVPGRWPESHPRDVYFTTGRSYVAAQPGQADEIWAAARTMLLAAGYEILVEGREEPGSIWKDWAFKGSKKAARNLAEGSAAAVSDSYVRRPGAQATSEFAQASAGLIVAMGDREGVHMFDNLVVGQFRGPDGEMRSFTKELTLSERRALDSNPAFLAEPANLLERLHQAGGGAVSQAPEPPSIGGIVN